MSVHRNQHLSLHLAHLIQSWACVHGRHDGNLLGYWICFGASKSAGEIGDRDFWSVGEAIETSLSGKG